LGVKKSDVKNYIVILSAKRAQITAKKMELKSNTKFSRKKK
jgi:hypothetical protein